MTKFIGVFCIAAFLTTLSSLLQAAEEEAQPADCVQLPSFPRQAIVSMDEQALVGPFVGGGAGQDTIHPAPRKQYISDGGLDIDTLIVPDGSYLVLRGKRELSFEVINSQNGRFDTIAVMGPFIQTAEDGKVELVSDRFDTIVLDPELSWHRQPDFTYSSMVFTAKQYDGSELQVTTPLDAYVVMPVEHSLRTIAGPISPSEDTTSAPVRQIGEGGAVTLTWEDAGTTAADFADVGNVDSVTLDVLNNEPNTLEIDLTRVKDKKSFSISILADPQDRLFLQQSNCWNIPDVEAGKAPNISLSTSIPGEINLTVPRSILDGPFVIAQTSQSGFFHLTADVNQRIDAIDLRNGVPNVVMLRNDERLKGSQGINISGDPGQDEIWIEGTAGWDFEFEDTGMVVTGFLGRDRPLRLVLEPGLKVRQLPTPKFMLDSGLAGVSAYPGIGPQSRRTKSLIVTRGGYVRLSANQTQVVNYLDLTNGIANILELRPDMFMDADEVKLFGDPGLDMVLPVDMPAHVKVESGAFSWEIERSDQTSRIVAYGLDLRLKSHGTVPAPEFKN